MARIRVQNETLTAYDAARRSYTRRYHALLRQADAAPDDAAYDAVMVKLAEANATLDAAKAEADANAEYVEVRS